MKKTVNDFMKSARNIRDGKHTNGTSLTIKHRENEGIVAIITKDSDYANRSGISNSGVTFHHDSFLHDLTVEQYEIWQEHFKAAANVEYFCKTLADEDGIFVCLSGTKVRALTRMMEPGRIVYDANTALGKS